MNSHPTFNYTTRPIKIDFTDGDDIHYLQISQIAISSDGMIGVVGQVGPTKERRVILLSEVGTILSENRATPHYIDDSYSSRGGPTAIAEYTDGTFLIGRYSSGSRDSFGEYIRHPSSGVSQFVPDGASEPPKRFSYSEDYQQTTAYQPKLIEAFPDGRVLQVLGGDVVQRHLSDGSLDPDFQQVTLRGQDIRDVEVLSDGSALVVTEGNNRLNLVKLSSSGGIDPLYGVDGSVEISVGAFDQSAYSVTVSIDGKIYLAGEADGDFVLVRLNMDGTVDTNFGTTGSGYTITPVGTIGDSARNILIQDDGKIVVVGNGGSPNVPSRSICVRYNTDGSIDTSFGEAGKMTVHYAGGSFAQLQDDGSIVIAGGSGIFRLTKDGHFDSSFSAGDASSNAVDLNSNSAVILFDEVGVFDRELSLLNDGVGNFDGASLKLENLDGQNSSDIFSFKTTESNTFQVENGRLTQGGKTFASFEYSTGRLSIIFTDTSGLAPGSELVNEVFRSIAYENQANLQPEVVHLGWVFNDGNQGEQGNGGSLSVSRVTTVNLKTSNVEKLIRDDLSASPIDENYFALEQLVGTFTAVDSYQRSLNYYASDTRFEVRPADTNDTLNLFVRAGTTIDFERLPYNASGEIGVDIIGHRAGSPGDIVGKRSFSFSVNNVEQEDVDASSAVSNIVLYSRNEGTAHFVGGEGNDSLSAMGNSGPNGNVLVGNAGHDRLQADGVGNIFLGGKGNDSLISQGLSDTMNGGEGDDTLSLDLTGPLTGEYDGGSGHDLLRLSTSNKVFGDLRQVNIENVERLFVEKGHITISGQQFLDLGPNPSVGIFTNTYGSSSKPASILEIRLGEVSRLDLSNAGVSRYSSQDTESMIRIASGSQPTHVIGSAARDYILGSSGDDSFEIGAEDTVDGGLGNDSVRYTSRVGYSKWEWNGPEPGGMGYSLKSIEEVIGSEQNDTLHGGGSDVRTFYGKGGADSIIGTSWDDQIFGGLGDDTLRGYDGDDTVSGGSGNDLAVVSIHRSAVDVFEISNGLLLVSLRGQDVIRDDIESVKFLDEELSYNDLKAQAKPVPPVSGTNAGENVDGTAAAEQINGLGGADWIMPGGGNDTVDGGAGNDMLSFINLPDVPGRTNLQFRLNVDLEAGTARNHDSSEVMQLRNIERVTGTTHADYIRGDDGPNHLRGAGDYDWFVATPGKDTLDGGAGQDMVTFVEWTNTGPNAVSDIFSADGAPPTAAQTKGVLVDLTHPANNSNLASGLTLISIERVTGSGRQDVFYGDGNSNDFRGLGGYDWFVGSTGGRERYFGGDGLDTVTYFRSTSGVTANLRNGAQKNGEETGYGSRGDAVRDLYFEIENLVGTGFDDRLTGNAGRNQLSGLEGDDFLFGFEGVDYIKGGVGDDTIDGGADSDYALFDGNRADYTVTRTGTDTVTVAGADGSDQLIDVEYFRFDDGDIRIWDL